MEETNLIIKPSVLIVDDEEAVREYIKTIATSLNYEVIGEAEDGVEALKLIKKLKPNILILDINMPKKTGIDVLEEMGGLTETTCIIILTTVSNIEAVKFCIEKKVSLFLRKDNSTIKMIQAIEKAWNTFIWKYLTSEQDKNKQKHPDSLYQTHDKSK